MASALIGRRINIPRWKEAAQVDLTHIPRLVISRDMCIVNGMASSLTSSYELADNSIDLPRMSDLSHRRCASQ